MILSPSKYGNGQGSSSGALGLQSDLLPTALCGPVFMKCLHCKTILISSQLNGAISFVIWYHHGVVDPELLASHDAS